MATNVELLARACVIAVEAYLLAGLLFGIWFVRKGVDRIDPHAHGSTAGFRLIILPGVAALWPVLVARLLSGAPEPREEWNPHRAAARRLSAGERPQ